MPERTRRSSAGECLDSELLSAYIDRTLEARDRARVEAHLASCADCYDVMSEVLRIQETFSAARPEGDAARDASTVAVPPPDPDNVMRGAFGRRQAVWAASGLLVAAAAVVLVVRTAPTWWTGVDPELADLVHAVGEERTVEARLTGGFQYGPLRSPVRSVGRSGPTDNWSLLAAAGRIREDVEKSPTPENLHASGVASLLIGEVDAGVQELERASELDAGRSSVVNDLAAAYFARYVARGDSEALPRALASIERVLARDPRMPEALFNRALVLQAMGRTEAAAAAWDAYLRVDDRSQWADEARKRFALLPTVPERR
jgi:Putative zinc-finger/Tetratricopeptide repeat